MRTLKVYLHGGTMGTPPRVTHKAPPRRGNVGGWSTASTRRNVAFLRSVEPDHLPITPDGEPLLGFAVTVTLRDCPATSDDWHRLRRAFLKRLERMGLYRMHWVTEWQRRGVPHLHGAIWFPQRMKLTDFRPLSHQLRDHWCDLAEPYGASGAAQHLAPITDAVGWFKYLAKHAARGVSHYQRSAENMPSGWVKTGRMWGYTGQWVTRDPVKLNLTSGTFYRLRRLVRSWRVADARASGDIYRLLAARKMLTCHRRELSDVRGVSEWVDQDTMLTLLDLARGSDEVVQVE